MDVDWLRVYSDLRRLWTLSQSDVQYCRISLLTLHTCRLDSCDHPKCGRLGCIIFVSESNFYTVCFNFDHYWRTIPENTIKLCNFLLITARYCLWQNRNLKMNNKTCNVYRYIIKKIKCRIKEEHRRATCKQKKKQFEQLWCIYK